MTYWTFLLLETNESVDSVFVYLYTSIYFVYF